MDVTQTELCLQYPQMVEVAVGSQLAVTPSASGPAIALKFDTTRFKDPQWQAQQAARREKFLITLVNDQLSQAADGQPMTEEQMREAGEQFDREAATAEAAAQNVDMDNAEAAPAESMEDSAAAAAAAAASSSTSMDAVATSADGSSPTGGGPGDASMGDAAPTFELTSADQLKLAVGKFSQELSRRITHGGERTLATLNDQMVKKAAFSRKNRK